MPRAEKPPERWSQPKTTLVPPDLPESRLLNQGYFWTPSFAHSLVFVSLQPLLDLTLKKENTAHQEAENRGNDLSADSVRRAHDAVS